MTKEQPQRPDPAAIDWRRKDAYRKDFSRHANLAFLIKSFGIGATALTVPILLPLVGGYEGHYSISYFYHVAATRDLFVGLLWALGLFLILFQGLSRAENLLLTVAGVLLILVAMVPTSPVQCTDTAFDWHEGFAIAFLPVCSSWRWAFPSGGSDTSSGPRCATASNVPTILPVA